MAANSTSQVIKQSAPRGISNPFYNCIDNAGSDTIALAACLSAEQALQDTRLNATYKALLGKLGPKPKNELVDAERAWLKLQNQSSKFEASLYRDEIIANLQSTQNETYRICERANALDTYLAMVSGQ